MSRFIQVAGTRDDLYALDEDGDVWVYRPANDTARHGRHYAGWFRLTAHRVDTVTRKKEENEKS